MRRAGRSVAIVVVPPATTQPIPAAASPHTANTPHNHARRAGLALPRVGVVRGTATGTEEDLVIGASTEPEMGL
jgi:hypothetical protein